MEASVDLNVKNEIEENLDIDESSSKNEKSLFLEEVEFQSIQDIKELTKSSLETWKEEYLFRLKRIFKNDIEKYRKRPCKLRFIVANVIIYTKQAQWTCIKQEY